MRELLAGGEAPVEGVGWRGSQLGSLTLHRILKETGMARITGIGGVFFKSRGDDRALAKWYSEHLGLELPGRRHIGARGLPRGQQCYRH